MKYVYHFLTWVALVFCLTSFPYASAESVTKVEPLQVRVAHSGTDLERIIYWSILKLVLEKSGQPYELSSQKLSSDTSVGRLLTNPEFLTVAWAGTTPEWEEKLRPVYIPLLGGLVGYRVFLIRKDRQPLFDSVSTVGDMTKLTAVLGRQWPDVLVMEEVGIRVASGNYQNLLPMLNAGRGDFFSRGILEINMEVDEKKYPDVGIEQSLMLYYPSAIYFHVAPGNDALHNALHKGFETAIADGSYEELLATHPLTQDIFKKLRLPERRLLKLDSSIVTEKTRAALEKYSIDPQVFFHKHGGSIPE